MQVIDDPIGGEPHPPYTDGTGKRWVWNQNIGGYIEDPSQSTTSTPGGPGVNPPPVIFGGGATPPPPSGSSSTPPAGMFSGSSGDFVAPPDPFSVAGWMGEQPTFTPERFTEPDPQTAMQDPSYQFEQSEGERALMQSAAARGVLNGGGTLKDITAWGQNYAASRIADVRNRAVSNYQLNYQAALDAFTGRMSGWQTRGQVGQRQNEDNWLHAYTPWNDTWNRRVTVATA